MSSHNSLTVNAGRVQALSDAFAMALYQTTSGNATTSAVATNGGASASVPSPAVNLAQQTDLDPSTPSSSAAGPPQVNHTCI